MRQLLENTVIGGYNNGLDEMHSCVSARHEYLHTLEEQLERREISIEFYVKQLTDSELLCAYTRQCCQQFR